MGTPQSNYHKNVDKWREFEIDLIELKRGREKYKGISAREETYAFIYRFDGAVKKTGHRLADVYKFKLECEKEHG